MRPYGKRVFEDPLDGVYPSRREFGRKRRRALKRKLRSRKKESRQGGLADVLAAVGNES